MADDPPKPTMSEQRRSDQLPSIEPNAAAEIIQLRRELEIVKNAVCPISYLSYPPGSIKWFNICQNPFRMAEIALELQIERLRVIEITRARDTALHCLSECCAVIRQKNEFIEQLQEGSGNNVKLDVSRQTHQFNSDAADVEQLKAHICSLEMSNEELRLSVAQLQLRATSTLDLPPCYEASGTKVAELLRFSCIDLSTIGHFCRGGNPDRCRRTRGDDDTCRPCNIQ